MTLGSSGQLQSIPDCVCYIKVFQSVPIRHSLSRASLPSMLYILSVLSRFGKFRDAEIGVVVSWQCGIYEGGILLG